MLFSTKRLIPTFVRHGSFAFLIPKGSTSAPLWLSSGWQFYNPCKEQLYKFPPKYELDRKIYLSEKVLQIYIAGDVTEKDLLPEFVENGEQELYTIVENKVDKLSHQLVTGIVTPRVLDAKILFALKEKERSWGILFKEVSTFLKDNDEFDDWSGPHQTIMYM